MATQIARDRVRRRPKVPNGASRALAWSFLNTAVSRFGTLGIGIVLARILGPQSYGTFAVAMVALLAVLSFNELGVSLAIVRWPEDPRRIAPTVSTISIACSSIFCVFGLIAAPAFSAAMGDPGATGVVRVLMFSVLVSGIVATPAALLQRNFDQKTRMAIDQVNVWLGAVISIVLAVAGMGAMSLAVGRLAGTVVSGVLFIAKSPLPLRFGLDTEYLKPLLRFGMPLAGTSIIVFSVGYLDQLVAGNLLGPVMLGFYVLAVNLANWPVSLFSQPLRSVAPAALSRLQHDPRQMQRTLISLIGVVAAVAFPAVAFIAAAARPLVVLVYGNPWAAAAGALGGLALLAGFRILFELLYDYLVVVGMAGSIMTTQILWLIALVPALLLGVSAGGLPGIAYAQLLVAAFVVLPLYLWRLHRAGIGPGAVFSHTWLPTLSAAVVLLLCSLMFSWIPSVPIGLGIAALVTVVTVAGLIAAQRTDLSQLLRVGRGDKDE